MGPAGQVDLSADADLVELLAESLSRDELITLLMRQSKLKRLGPKVNEHQSLEGVAREVVDVLRRLELLNVEFFDDLLDMAKRRTEEICAIARRLNAAPERCACKDDDAARAGRLEAVSTLLASLFADVPALRAFVRTLSKKQALLKAVSPPPTMHAYCAQLAEAILESDDAPRERLFDDLLRWRPARHREVVEVAELWWSDYLPSPAVLPDDDQVRHLVTRSRGFDLGRHEPDAVPDDLERLQRQAVRHLIIGDPLRSAPHQEALEQGERRLHWNLGIAGLLQIMDADSGRREAWHEAVRVLTVHADLTADEAQRDSYLSAAMRFADRDHGMSWRDGVTRSRALTRRCQVLERRFIKDRDVGVGLQLAQDALDACQELKNETDALRAWNAARWPVIVHTLMKPSHRKDAGLAHAIVEAERYADLFLQRMGGDYEGTHWAHRHLDALIREGENIPMDESSPPLPPFWTKTVEKLREMRDRSALYPQALKRA